ncbi:MAG TPA: toxin-antitoxin system HicB family antitoxin [Pseudonocardiaceae bacterium]|nr:toxin-antitoxin system HicB family antitoxin [Pseudonocardiaceae bacterium]
MITRLDDELHARLKALAASEGISLNEITVQALNALIHQPLTRKVVRGRARDAGWLVELEEPAERPDPERVRAAQTGTGHAVSEALQADRGEW